MTENKRFTSQRTDDYNYSDILDNGKWIGICHVDCEDDFVDKLNELNDEIQRLKKALLFFVDVANTECSSRWDEDMEKDCQRLFNCSYEEAKEKYGDYDCSWWEIE